MSTANWFKPIHSILPVANIAPSAVIEWSKLDLFRNCTATLTKPPLPGSTINLPLPASIPFFVRSLKWTDLPCNAATENLHLHQSGALLFGSHGIKTSSNRLLSFLMKFSLDLVQILKSASRPAVTAEIQSIWTQNICFLSLAFLLLTNSSLLEILKVLACNLLRREFAFRPE